MNRAESRKLINLLFNDMSIKVEFKNGECTIKGGWGGFFARLISLDEFDPYTVVDISFDQGEGGDDAMHQLALYILNVGF